MNKVEIPIKRRQELTVLDKVLNNVEEIKFLLMGANSNAMHTPEASAHQVGEALTRSITLVDNLKKLKTDLENGKYS